jgi:membrane associated rhomboid family serine protease
MGDVRLKRAFAVAGLFTAALWVIQTGGTLSETPLGLLGVRPGSVAGLHGVVTAPLVHGSFTHLLTNTPPLLVLGTAMMYGFPRAAKIALPMVWLGSGLGVWLFGRDAVHLGASGLTYGMMFFVFVMGVLRRDRPSMALAMIVAFLYGGMVWGILPLKPDISFESHLFGAIAGVAAAFLLRRRDPPAKQRTYEWEEVPSTEAEDPVIGEPRHGRERPEGSTGRRGGEE